MFGTLQITGTSEAVAGLVRVQESLAGTGDSAVQASAAIDRTSIALAGAGRATAVAADGSAKLRAAQLSAIAATERYNAVLADEDASLARLASSEASVINAQERVAAAQAKATAATDASVASMNAAGAASGGLASKLSGPIEMAAKLGVAFGAFELIKKAIDITKQAAEFQRAMEMIQTNANASAAEVKNMSQAVLALSPQVATGPNDLALSLYHIEQNGLRGSTALDVLKTAAEGAKIGNADLEQTTNSMTSAVKSGIPGVQNLDQAMGALIATVGTGDMKMSDLNEALGSGLLSAAKNYGLSLNDVGSALAVFGDLNIRGANAATQLRMSIMNLAAPAKGGKAALEGIGLSMTDLGQTMQKGGLLPAIDELVAHMDQAGITGTKVGQFLTEAFGKRAGVGLGVLVDQVQLLHTKMDELNAGSAAGAFEQKWTETTQTASFALHKLGAEFDATGIQLANSLLPTVNTAAHWLGTTLPDAISTLQSILKPLEEEVGGALVMAWHALSDVLGVVGTTLADIGHFAADNKGVLTDLATVVGVLWLGFKGYALAVTAMTVVGDGMLALRAKALLLADSFTAVAAGEEALAVGPEILAIAALTFGVYELGKAFNSWLESGNSAIKVMDNLSSTQKSFNQALSATNGLIDENVLKTVGQQLQASGLADKAKAAGIGMADLIQGVTGGTNAFQALVAQWKAGGKPSSDTITALAMMASTFTTTSTRAKDLATGVKTLSDQQSNAGVSATDLAAADTSLAQMTQTLTDVTKDLGSQMDLLTTSSSTSQDAFMLAISAFEKATATQDSTAARAALIGATLKAANGDMLGFAASMNAAATADDALGTSLANAAKTAGVSVGQLLNQIVDAKTGTINYKDAAAAPLISSLTSMQDAAVKAASAIYQHETALGNASAMTDAFNVYTANTKTVLYNEAVQAGKSNDAAKKLSDTYFGMPSDVKTMIQAEGTDPIVTVLDKIGRMLAAITGQPWDTTVDANTAGATGPLDTVQGQLNSLHDIKLKAIVDTNEAIANVEALAASIAALPGPIQNLVGHRTDPTMGHAAGGTIIGPGTSTSDSIVARLSNGEEVINAKQATKHRALLKAINAGMDGFADGGTVGGDPIFIPTVHATTVAGKSSSSAATKAANAAAAAAKAWEAVQTSFEYTNLPNFAKALGGTASQVQSAGQSLVAALAKVATQHAQVTANMVNTLKLQVTELDNEAKQKDALAAQLKSANAALDTVRKAELADAQKIAQSLNNFNIATDTPAAGAGPTTAAGIQGLAIAQSGLTAAQTNSTNASAIAGQQMTDAVNAAAYLKTAQDSGIKSQIDAAQAALDAASAKAAISAAAAQQAAATATAAQAAVTAASSTGTGVAGLIGDLQAANDQAKQFADQMTQLTKMGLNNTDLNQLATGGDTAANMARIQTLLQATPDQIKQINDLTTSLGTTATNAGDQVATGLYKAGIDAAQGLVDGITSQEGAIAAAMKALSDKMVSTVKSELGIKSPSTVFRALGGFTGHGFALGMGDSEQMITSAAKSLANASIPKVTVPGRSWAGALPPVTGDRSADLLSSIDRKLDQLSQLHHLDSLPVYVDGTRAALAEVTGLSGVLHGANR